MVRSGPAGAGEDSPPEELFRPILGLTGPGGIKIMCGSLRKQNPLQGKTMIMKTYMAKKGELATKWHVVDATDKIVGRLATKIATILQGKHRPEYTPHVDTGDFVIVINAEKVRITGNNKPAQRVYRRYSGYPSGQTVISFEKMLAKHPDRIVSEAVRRMMPKSKLGSAMLKKLKVYAGPDHPHQAQQPQPLDI